MKTLKSPRDLLLPKGVSQCTITLIREASALYAPPLCDTPDKAAEAFRTLVPTEPLFDWEKEWFVVFLLTTRRRLVSWQLVSSGSLDTCLAHPRDVFRAAIVANAHAVVVAHNHPSGDPTPSDSDIRATRDLIRAGQVLKIEVLDHVIIGNPALAPGRGFTSLRELGYWHA
jgi:DNA repair protein RadC